MSLGEEDPDWQAWQSEGRKVVVMDSVEAVEGAADDGDVEGEAGSSACIAATCCLSSAFSVCNADTWATRPWRSALLDPGGLLLAGACMPGLFISAPGEPQPHGCEVCELCCIDHLSCSSGSCSARKHAAS